MPRILGKPTSIDVRKVLWLCEELALPYELEARGAGSRNPRVAAYCDRLVTRAAFRLHGRAGSP